MGTAAERPGLLAFLTGLQGKKCPSPRESSHLHCYWVKLAEAWNPGEGLRRSSPLAADPRSPGFGPGRGSTWGEKDAQAVSCQQIEGRGGGEFHSGEKNGLVEEGTPSRAARSCAARKAGGAFPVVPRKGWLLRERFAWGDGVWLPRTWSLRAPAAAAACLRLACRLVSGSLARCRP